MLFDQIWKLKFLPAKVIQMIIESLDFRLSAFKRIVFCLFIRFVGKNEFYFGMGIFPNGFGQFHHIGFDACGGHIQILQV